MDNLHNTPHFHRIGIVAGLAPTRARALIERLKRTLLRDFGPAALDEFWEAPEAKIDEITALRDEKMIVLDAALECERRKAELLIVVTDTKTDYEREIAAETTLPLYFWRANNLDQVINDLCTMQLSSRILGCKIGMIGGLGPAATVDLFDKIVRNTHASTDQEHFKLVIEENPQIPDRTACLLAGGEDPTVSLYHAAKRLEEAGCNAIIIPCNTAHAFVPTLKRRISIPFIDMQESTLEAIRSKFHDARVGLLATSGTIATGIYSAKAEKMGITLEVPDESYQKLVMSAIYGEKGAKAGYTDGLCRKELLTAAEHLVRDKNCTVLILGCTELPLILDEADAFPLAGKTVAFVDPTATLARRVVEFAELRNAARGVR